MYYVFSLITYLKKNRLWSLANKFLKELAVNLWTFRIYFFGLPRLVQKDRQACQEKGLWRSWWVVPVHFQSHVLVCSFDTWWKWWSHTRKMENTTITHSKHSCQCGDQYPECGHGNLQGDAADRLWLQPGIVMAIYYTWKKNKTIFIFIISCVRTEIKVAYNWNFQQCKDFSKAWGYFYAVHKSM